MLYGLFEIYEVPVSTCVHTHIEREFKFVLIFLYEIEPNYGNDKYMIIVKWNAREGGTSKLTWDVVVKDYMNLLNQKRMYGL